MLKKRGNQITVNKRITYNKKNDKSNKKDEKKTRIRKKYATKMRTNGKKARSEDMDRRAGR